MRRYQIALLILVASASLTGCGRGETTTTFVNKRLTVSGLQYGVERFAKLQGSRRPALAMSPIKLVSDGRAEATVTFPASFTGDELIHTTREALAAGLNYNYEERRSTATLRS